MEEKNVLDWDNVWTVKLPRNRPRRWLRRDPPVSHKCANVRSTTSLRRCWSCFPLAPSSDVGCSSPQSTPTPDDLPMSPTLATAIRGCRSAPWQSSISIADAA